MSAAVGAVVLVVQLLIEIEQRLSSVESKQANHADAIHKVVDDGFTKINEATRLFGSVASVGLNTDGITQLAQNAARLGPDVPTLISEFAQSEIDRVTEVLGALADHELTHEGEDHVWLLTLTRLAATRIDAVSLHTVDAGGNIFAGGFWVSVLGQFYLDLQRKAIMREVEVRRVFIIEHDQVAAGTAFQRICRAQADCGVAVRILAPSTAPMTIRRRLQDYTVFDNAISYEVTSGLRVEESADPLITQTRLVSEPRKVAERKSDYALLWESAVALSDVS